MPHLSLFCIMLMFCVFTNCNNFFSIKFAKKFFKKSILAAEKSILYRETKYRYKYCGIDKIAGLEIHEIFKTEH